MTTLGFYGFGKMAQAIWDGAQHSHDLDRVLFYRRNQEERERLSNHYGIDATDSPAQLIDEADIVVMAVKPQGIKDVLADIKETHNDATLTGKCWVSILAGTTIETFQSALGPDSAIIRVMPNTPSVVGAGMAGMTASASVSDDRLTQVRVLFDAVGQTCLVSEEQLHTVTAISGSGPAFVYQLAAAIVEEAGTMGMDPDTALQLAAQTFVGAGRMLQEAKRTPQELIDQVVSPGGTTQAGLEKMAELGCDDAYRAVIRRAAERSIELSKL